MTAVIKKLDDSKNYKNEFIIPEQQCDDLPVVENNFDLYSEKTVKNEIKIENRFLTEKETPDQLKDRLEAEKRENEFILQWLELATKQVKQLKARLNI